jgi:radical SAM protein with 4Fe4S-binding SPASM domain
MRYYLSSGCALKSLETPGAYVMGSDELYELDAEGFGFLRKCARREGCEAGDLEGEFIEYCLAEGILDERPVEVRRPPLEESGSPSLRYLELQVTRRCNLSCGHCYLGHQRDVELSVGEIRMILEEFQAMQGLRFLITGGEPLLHRRFGEINAMLPDYALRTVLFTNGTLLDAKVLGTLNVHEVQVSIDGLEEAHDALRGKGSFRRTLRGVRAALEAGFDISVSTMVHAANLDDFEGMRALFSEMAIREWSVDVPCPEGNMRESSAFALPPETAGRYLGYGFEGGLHGGGEGFACGLHLMSVTAEGYCAKCAFYAEEPVGHWREGLSECWRRIRPVRLAELDCDCEAADACRGGCRYRAACFGDPLSKDPYRCALYGKL